MQCPNLKWLPKAFKVHVPTQGKPYQVVLFGRPTINNFYWLSKCPLSKCKPLFLITLKQTRWQPVLCVEFRSRFGAPFSIVESPKTPLKLTVLFVPSRRLKLVPTNTHTHTPPKRTWDYSYMWQSSFDFSCLLRWRELVRLRKKCMYVRRC